MGVVHAIWIWGGYIGIVLASGFAFWRGGWAERAAAAAILIAWLLTPLAQRRFDPTMGGIVIDAVTAVILCGISLKARRIWTIFASGSMVGAVACHLMAGVFSSLGYFAYITALGLLSGFYLIIVLTGGVFEHLYLTKQAGKLALVRDA